VIRIKPEPENQFVCPRCLARTPAKEIIVQSAFTLADCICKNCGFEFYQTLAAGHTTTDSLFIDKLSRKLYPPDTPKTWLSEALLKTFSRINHHEVPIQKIIHENRDHVVILNTLDFLYGHVLLKLYNAVHHLDHNKNLGLVLILPKSFEWLVPNGCAEIWLVDLKLSDLAAGNSFVQQFIATEFRRFRTIYVSKAYSHPDFTNMDIERFTGIKPFDLAVFNKLAPVITFILREDRWWLGGPTGYWFYRLCRKLRVLKWGRRVLSMRQNNLIKRTISIIRKQLPETSFLVAGMGTTGNFYGYALDKRKDVIDEVVEKDWCKIYARSQIVAGVHGSNMLLPTAHAAGCVEILPEDRYGNIIQDISVRYADRRQLYFYRFADQYASPKTIARKVISMLSNYRVFHKNMCANIYQADAKPREHSTMYTTIFAPFADDANR